MGDIDDPATVEERRLQIGDAMVWLLKHAEHLLPLFEPNEENKRIKYLNRILKYHGFYCKNDNVVLRLREYGVPIDLDTENDNTSDNVWEFYILDCRGPAILSEIKCLKAAYETEVKTEIEKVPLFAMEYILESWMRSYPQETTDLIAFWLSKGRSCLTSEALTLAEQYF